MSAAFLRTVFLYIVIIIAIRIMGKRQIGELEPSELVVTILMSELAAIPMQDLGTPLLYGVIPIATLLCLTLFMSAGMLKSLRFRALICGKPSILMENGRIMQRELRKNRLTTDELVEELRVQSITDLATVQYAILETNGQLSVILYPEYQLPAKKDFGIHEQTNGLPVILINDGTSLDHNREKMGLDPSWIAEQVKKQGIDHIQNVFLLIVDERNNVYCLPKESKK